MLDIKKLLYSYKKLEVGLENINRSLQHLQVNKEYPSGVASYSDMPKGSGISNTTERFAIRNITEQEQTDQKKAQLLADREAYEETIQVIRTALQTLSEQEAQLIRLRYFQGHKMSRVAMILECSDRQATFLHYQSLQAINQCLNGGNLDLKLKWFYKKESQANTG